tara:strand:+ start:345 stop:560 length:216 start_codon:yes stop_codon:yes gene_type:complete
MHTIRKTDDSWQVGYYNLAEWETVIDVALGHWEHAARWTNYLNGGSETKPTPWDNIKAALVDKGYHGFCDE